MTTRLRALDDCKVTPECHAVVAQGTLTPMAFQVGKGMGNEHKNKNLKITGRAVRRLIAGFNKFWPTFDSYPLVANSE